ncbi:hypothetical protein [Variovorax atrisoli]|uniref:hypothetical protein n=1 Tax=Variovorax atrisoli TaxID=3394203 RepID=UPI00339578ED
MRIRIFSLAASTLVLALGLSACGGGGGGGGGGFGPFPSGGGTTTTPPPAADNRVAVSGIVATGAPASGSSVTLRCANGVSGAATTGTDGAWSARLDAPAFPCLVIASGGSLPAGQKLHSMLRAAGYVNVTPLTELILARAAGMAPGGIEQAEPSALAALAAKLDKAQADIVALLNESGYGAFVPNPFTSEFKAVAGDAYDDFLEHLALSLADGDTTLDGIVAALIAAAQDDSFDLPLTHTFKPAELAAQVQLNKAHLASAAGVLSMKLDAGSNPVGAYVGGGAGNKAVLQLPGLAGTKVKDLKRIELELKGDAGGIGQGLPYAYLNFTVDLNCDAAPLASNATLSDVRARRRILVFDTYYHFMQANNAISTTEFRSIAITPATPGWRISGGTPVGTVAVNPNYNGSETLEGFDYAAYPNACIVDGITGDGGMPRNASAAPNCATNSALPGSAPAVCGAPYSGPILVLGDSGTTTASQWTFKRVKVEARRKQTFRF